MPASTDAHASATRSPPTAEAVGGVLRFAGVLTRATVPAVWKSLPALDGVRTLDLREVTELDSAGLALLSLVSGRCGGAAIEGDPGGLAELRSAYRLDRQLGF